MTVWLVKNVYGDPIAVFSTQQKAEDFVALHQSSIVTHYTPSSDIVQLPMDP